jgi:hypothetical protein
LGLYWGLAQNKSPESCACNEKEIRNPAATKATLKEVKLIMLFLAVSSLNICCTGSTTRNITKNSVNKQTLVLVSCYTVAYINANYCRCVYFSDRRKTQAKV